MTDGYKSENAIKRLPLFAFRTKVIIYLGPLMLGLLCLAFIDWRNEMDEAFIIMIAFSGLSLFIWIVAIALYHLFPTMNFDGENIVIKKGKRDILISQQDIDIIKVNFTPRGPDILNIYTKRDGNFQFWEPECLSDCFVEDKVKLFKCLKEWYATTGK